MKFLGLIIPLLFMCSAKASQLGCEDTVKIEVLSALEDHLRSDEKIFTVNLIESFHSLDVWRVNTRGIADNGAGWGSSWVVLTRKAPMDACSVESVVLDQEF